MSWTGICLVCNCRELWLRRFLVPCPAPVTVGELPPGLVSVDDFHAETFHDAPDGAPGLDASDGDSLRSCFAISLIARVLLISPSFCCRPGW